MHIVEGQRWIGFASQVHVVAAPLVAQGRVASGCHAESGGVTNCHCDGLGLHGDRRGHGCGAAIRCDCAKVGDVSDDCSATLQRCITGDDEAIGKGVSATQQFQRRRLVAIAHDKWQTVGQDTAFGPQRAAAENQLAL